MGLDMYLTGDKYTPCFGDSKREVVDGYEVESQRLKLGYWRKHWALHNYIEENYSENNGGRLYLESEDLRDIATAVAEGKLVDQDDLDDWTVNALRKAADWLDGGEWNSVEYFGSW